MQNQFSKGLNSFFTDFSQFGPQYVLIPTLESEHIVVSLFQNRSFALFRGYFLELFFRLIRDRIVMSLHRRQKVELFLVRPFDGLGQGLYRRSLWKKRGEHPFGFAQGRLRSRGPKKRSRSTDPPQFCAHERKLTLCDLLFSLRDLRVRLVLGNGKVASDRCDLLRLW